MTWSVRSKMLLGILWVFSRCLSSAGNRLAPQEADSIGPVPFRGFPEEIAQGSD
jgi:hypothetical protein